MYRKNVGSELGKIKNNTDEAKTSLARTSINVGDPVWIQIQLGHRIRTGNPDPDPGRLKLSPQKR